MKIDHNNHNLGTDYSLNITRGEVVYVGENMNITRSSCLISSSVIRVGTVVNYYYSFNLNLMLP